MYEAPWTQIGQLQQEIDRLKGELSRKAETHEIHTLAGRMDSLERTLWDIRSAADGYLSRIQACEDKIAEQEGETDD